MQEFISHITNTTSVLNQVLRLLIWIIIIASFVFAIVLNNRLLVLLAVGLLGIEVVIQGVKLGVKEVFGINSITKRPKGAKDCGAFIDCDKKDATSMGMPSGHSMSMAFFATFVLLATNPDQFQNYIIVILALTVMSQRWWVGCHSLLQIFIGGGIGILLGWGC